MLKTLFVDENQPPKWTQMNTDGTGNLKTVTPRPSADFRAGNFAGYEGIPAWVEMKLSGKHTLRQFELKIDAVKCPPLACCLCVKTSSY
ncbi:MAG: hypothetical protein LBG28_00480 [Tannerella sp.]|nr:hypothetical protein [Tannerella sp.]